MCSYKNEAMKEFPDFFMEAGTNLHQDGETLERSNYHPFDRLIEKAYLNLTRQDSFLGFHFDNRLQITSADKNRLGGGCGRWTPCMTIRIVYSLGRTGFIEGFDNLECHKIGILFHGAPSSRMNMMFEVQRIVWTSELSSQQPTRRRRYLARRASCHQVDANFYRPRLRIIEESHRKP